MECKSRPHFKGLFFFLLALSALVAAPIEVLAKTHFHWVQLIQGPDQEELFRPSVMVRAVVDKNDDCSAIYAKKKMRKVLAQMVERYRIPALSDGFSEIKVCEAYFGPEFDQVSKFSTVYLKDGKKALSLVLPDVSKGLPLGQMVSYGCVGCRDRIGTQACYAEDEEENDKKTTPWIFQSMNEYAAKESGDGIPPLLVGLGDYRYSGQSDKKEDKLYVPDTWSSVKYIDEKGKKQVRLGWKEEVFAPMEPMLSKSFLVMMRGNHEACYVKENQWFSKNLGNRGDGYFYFFGTGNQNCQDIAGAEKDSLPPFAFDAVITGGTARKPIYSNDKVRLVFMDTVRTGDSRDKEAPESVALYTRHFNTIALRYVQPLTGTETAWIMGHIPAYAIKKMNLPMGEKANGTDVLSALQESDLAKDLEKVSLFNSAHVHQYNMVPFPDGKGTTQIVVGNGGVALSGRKGDTLCYLPDSPSGWQGIQTANFGYLHAKFSVGENNKVTASYDMPFFKAKWGDAKEMMRVTCSGDADSPTRMLCPDFSKQDGVIGCPVK